jgi:hypothetical protein
MPISEDNGDGSRMFIKPQYRGHGRYQNRDVFDQNLREGEELWSAAAADADHPMRNAKGSIAQLAATPYQIAKASIPNSTFKGGFTPRTFEVMSLEGDWDNAESTNQSVTPMMTKVEQAGLMRMSHMLPAKYRAGMQPGEGKDQNLMVGDWRYRTNYATDQKPTKFNDGRRTYTDLHQFQAAVPNYRKNKGIAGQPTQEEYKEAEYLRARGTGLGSMMERSTAMSALNAAKAAFTEGPGKGMTAAMSSGLFNTWLDSSGEEAKYQSLYGISLKRLAGNLKAGQFGYT